MSVVRILQPPPISIILTRKRLRQAAFCLVLIVFSGYFNEKRFLPRQITQVLHCGVLVEILLKFVHMINPSEKSTSVDLAYADSSLAEIYDYLNSWGASDEFYLRLAVNSDSVLDVGCGTGLLLHRARDAGHRGVLCGVDPGLGMIHQAQKRTDITWILGDLESAPLTQKFDLILMTGHVFQVFGDDASAMATLKAAANVMADGGKLAFETRNPINQPWKKWNQEQTINVPGWTESVHIKREASQKLVDNVIRLTETFRSSNWDEPKVSRSELRFFEVQKLERLLIGAGLAVEQQYGDWSMNRLSDDSPEIITVARKA